ncbi:MAG: hypothetical protein IVW53_04870 [Chloroflexi bacterium]|nr:hypothetical protein [Chloroflexota bacterium]
MEHPGRRAGRLVLGAVVGILVAILTATSVAVIVAPADIPGSTATAPTFEPALPAAVTAASPATQPDLPPAIQPSIQYEEAAAHAHDPIRFTPGPPVEVGFTPSSADNWPVGGGAPTALPAAGAASRVMALGPNVAVQNVAATTKRRREVFGFLPYWTLGDRTTRLDYSLLSTIAYFSVGVDRSGNLVRRNPDGSTALGWAGWTSSALSSVITAAHRRSTRVVLTISMFGWTTAGAALQGATLGSASARRNLARQAAAAVRARGADGINLDVEPLAAGRAREFTALVRAMRTELDRVHRGYQVTFDTTGWIGNYPVEAATARGGADAIFIMGYDYRTAGTSIAGSIDPLGGSGYTLADTIAAYTARVSPSKLILGLPYFGRAWSTTTNAVRAPNRSGTRYGTSNPVLYSDAASFATVYGRRYDPTEQVAWFSYRRLTCTTSGCATSWRQVYFDDAQALRARCDLVIRSGLRGVGIWALGYDGTRPELNRALALAFLHDTAPPASG